MAGTDTSGRSTSINGAEAGGGRGDSGGVHREENPNHDGPEREKDRRGVLAPREKSWGVASEAVERRRAGIPPEAIVSALSLLVIATIFYLGVSIRGSFADLEWPGSSASARRDAGGAIGGPVRSAREIQERIDRAAPGAVIEIAPGTYEGTLRIRGKAVTLRSRDGAEATVIDGGGAAGPVIAIRAAAFGPEPRLEGLTIRGGRGADGSGLLVEGCDPLLARCRFIDHDGGGVVLVESRALLDECDFIGNRATPFGAGLQSINSSPVIMACRFEGNRALTAGGAIHARGGGPMIARSRFLDNRTTSGAWGGAIFADSSDLTVIDSEFIANGSGEAGGAVYLRHGGARIERCAFESNSAGSAWSLLSDGALAEVRWTRFCGARDSNLGGSITEGRGNEFVDACARDCNGNGIPDHEEIADGRARDQDGNGVIDECERPAPDPASDEAPDAATEHAPEPAPPAERR